MTKNVRVENADTSSYKVTVEVWEKGADSKGGTPGDDTYVAGTPDVMVHSEALAYPTQMGTYTIHSGRYLRIVEGP